MEELAAALAAGDLVVIPTDTVYGLACRPDDEQAVRRLSAVKGRSPEQPIALVATSVEALTSLVPEVPARVVRGLLPGPYTLVVPNPARRLHWLAGARPETLGVRVPAVTGLAAEALERLQAVAATSANVHGGPDPRRLSDVAAEIMGTAAASLDGGELPGAPSTVLDLTGAEPQVLREGAVPAAEALARLAKGLSE